MTPGKEMEALKLPCRKCKSTNLSFFNTHHRDDGSVCLDLLICVFCVKCQSQGSKRLTVDEAVAAWNHGYGRFVGWSANQLKIYIEELEAKHASDHPSASQGWQTMESAPKDGTIIWTISHDKTQQQAEFFEGVWWFQNEGLYASSTPTHWQPLPAAPAQEKTK